MEDKKRLVKDFVTGTDEHAVLLKPLEGGRIEYFSEYFGDHSDNWLIRYDANGIEHDRYNIKYVANFEWMPIK